jgi:uroporphyrinogen decarboxylase
MTSAERVAAVLDGKIPDRVPVWETLIDWHVIGGLGFRDYFQMLESLELDAISLNQLMYAPASLDDIEWVDPVRRTFRDTWGVLLQLTEEAWPIPVDSVIKEPEDFLKLVPPDPRDDRMYKALTGLPAQYRGRKAIITVARAVFTSSFMVRGMENLLVDYLLDPELAKAIGRTVGRYNQELHRLLLGSGVDVIILGDDYAHKTDLIMSPANFREFILPGFAEVVGNIKRSGGRCIKHSDGNIWKIIDALVDTGVDGLGPLEPGAGMDLSEVKRRYAGKVCVVGNLDVDLLCRGTPEQVRAATRRLISEVSPGGRHILSSGNSIPASVKPENLRAMVEAAKELGRYPDLSD